MFFQLHEGAESIEISYTLSAASLALLADDDKPKIVYPGEKCWEATKGEIGWIETRIHNAECDREEGPYEIGLYYDAIQRTDVLGHLYLRYRGVRLTVFYPDPISMPNGESFLQDDIDFVPDSFQMEQRYPGHEWALDRWGANGGSGACSARTLSDQPADWSCAFDATYDGHHSLSVSSPSSYADYEWSDYGFYREALLILLGGILGFVSSAIYSELEHLTNRSRRVAHD